MGSKKEIKRIKELPPSLIDKICDHLTNYVVGLLLIKFDGQNESLTLIGIGTLVTINNLHCILTADHVLGLIPNDGTLGIIAAFKGELKRYVFQVKILNICRIAKGDDDSKGPDIGAIILPDTEIGFLKSEKTFFNIDKRKERVISAPLNIDMGAWFTLGVPGETEKNFESEKGFTVIKGYQALCGAGGIENEYQNGDYDYLEMVVDYNLDPNDLPKSFGGLSGSGLWQIPLKENSDGEIREIEYILSGVVFYQSSMKDNIRVLKCHGRKSVYLQVYDYVSRIKNS